MSQIESITAPKANVITPSGVFNKPFVVGALYIHKMERTRHSLQSGIYQIKSIVNGKIYIGSSINLKRRKKEHFDSLSKSNHKNTYLIHHTNKYGIEDLEFIVLERCGKDNLIQREQYYIDTLKPQFNLSPTAGSNLGFKYTEESKEKYFKGKNNPMYGRKGILAPSYGKKGTNSPNYGKHHTEETKNIIANTSAERWKNPEYKENVSKKIGIKLIGNQHGKGYHHSLEAKKKISISKLGNTNGHFRKNVIPGNETRLKMRLAKLGTKQSEETKNKKRLSMIGKNVGKIRSEKIKKLNRLHRLGKPSPMKGKTHSEETKLKMSLAAKNRKRL